MFKNNEQCCTVCWHLVVHCLLLIYWMLTCFTIFIIFYNGAKTDKFSHILRFKVRSHILKKLELNTHFIYLEKTYCVHIVGL